MKKLCAIALMLITLIIGITGYHHWTARANSQPAQVAEIPEIAPLAAVTCGTPGFSLQAAQAVGITPFSVAIGDINNDGNLDFATANFNSNNVSIRLGDGLGGFS